MDPKRHRGRGVDGHEGQRQMPEHPPATSLPPAVFAKPKGCGCRSSLPGASHATAAAGRLPASFPGPRQRLGASWQPRQGQEDRATHPKERPRLSSGPREAASAPAHICPHLPGGRGRLRSWACRHGPGDARTGKGHTPLTYFSYSALSRSQRESLCFCQSLPCLQVVRRTTSSPLWT